MGGVLIAPVRGNTELFAVVLDLGDTHSGQ
jgi:hypothetical protein